VERESVDLVSFARHYISNPDLVDRFRGNQALSPSDLSTYYKGGARAMWIIPVSVLERSCREWCAVGFSPTQRTRKLCHCRQRFTRISPPTVCEHFCTLKERTN
jgi:hypothetical protein